MNLSGTPARFDPDLARALAHVPCLPGYAPTPLHRLARPPGESLWLKDERDRMGLGAFKAIGGMHAVVELTRGVEATPLIVCASAGNHGVAVAAGAAHAGARARIHLPAGTSPGFAHRIERLGGEIRWSSGDYEAACADARHDAEATGAIWLPDGDPDPYAVAPHMVMEGYQMLAEEIRRSCELRGDWPASVYLQAGVGGLAAAVAHHIRHHWRAQPEIVVVEAAAAPCLAVSAAAGRPIWVLGPRSIMSRLDCKAPSWLAWATLAALDVRYATVDDNAADAAVVELSAAGFATTPSGAAGYAALSAGHAAGGPALAILTEAPLSPTLEKRS